jgi:NADPH-dependent F420 reductase
VKVGFIGGTGDEGRGLAYRFALAGHACIIGSRSTERAFGAVNELRAQGADLPISGGTNAEAAEAGEIVVVTTPYDAQRDTLPPLAAALAGKVVVSTVVPMRFGESGATLAPVAAGSAAQEEQALLPESTVVAAFQNLSARKLLKGGPVDADVVVCADDAEAKRRVVELAGSIEGVRGIDGGPLANAALVEGITVLLVAVNRAYRTQAGIRIAGV